ncbi:MAG: hypothetical protein JXR76_13610 [Deltaproteobacteria bacterium]|nr:hypothetical protein [Deltaproteobacteria bacterium]
MFEMAGAFDQDLSTWDVANVTDFCGGMTGGGDIEGDKVDADFAPPREFVENLSP